ncbi:MAG TPA: hypothetical protein RMH99_04425 [Sandaracinaceae bacterium LLY-WYZ-13_1]|nr:hypothetical protein [Sandaracinaceae bacterium LLY-WYZ-13_1]
MTTRAHLFTSMITVLGAAACANAPPDADPAPTLERAEVAAGKADGSTDALCRYVGASPGCDLCEELRWYYDGICDGFCDHADPDCGTESELCASLYGDGFADCQAEGFSGAECLGDEGYDRPYQRGCCAERDYAYCPHLTCADAVDADTCLAIDGCAWGTGAPGEGCVYTGDVHAGLGCESARSEDECLAAGDCAWGLGAEGWACTTVGTLCAGVPPLSVDELPLPVALSEAALDFDAACGRPGGWCGPMEIVLFETPACAHDGTVDDATALVLEALGERGELGGTRYSDAASLAADRFFDADAGALIEEIAQTVGQRGVEALVEEAPVPCHNCTEYEVRAVLYYPAADRVAWIRSVYGYDS